MESGKYSKSDPAVMLLNEIEILLAQARLTELYIKQADAIADDEMARLHESYDRELTLLRAELTAKDEIFKRRQTEPVIATDARAQIESLEYQLADERRAVENREAALQNAKADADYLHDRINQLETVHQQAQAAVGQAVLARQELEAELDTVRSQLANQQESLQEHQLVARQIQHGLEIQIGQLQDKLQSQALIAADEITGLRQQVGDLQLNFDQIQERAAREIETAQSQSNAELTDLCSRLEARERGYAAMIEAERALKSEIFALQSQLEQNQALLQSRNQEASADAGRISVIEQELATAHAEAEKHRALHRADQDSIVELEHQVAVKERALSERQEAVSAVELALHDRIQTLQQELARNRSEVQERDVEVKTTQAQAEILRERITELELAAASAEARAQELVKTERYELENEITGLRATLARQESAASSLENALKSALDELSTEKSQRRDELEHQHQLTDQANCEIEQLRTALVTVESQRAIETTTALREQDTTFKALEAQWNEEIGQLRAQLQERQNATAEAHDQSGRLRDEIAELAARHARLDQLRLQVEEDRDQSAHLCHELEINLQAKTDELRAVQADAAERTSQIEVRIKELEYRLTEKQLLVETHAVESAKLKSELSSALEQLAEREAVDNATKAKYFTEVESARAVHLEEVAKLQKEFHGREQALEHEIADARQTEAQLKAREQELVTEAETWHARFDLVETLRQNEQVTNKENDRARQALESELVSLRHELQQKAWTMAQQQANLENLALAHKNQIHTLESRIDEQRRGIEERDAELGNTRSRVQSMEGRIEDVQAELRQAEEAARKQTQQLTQEYLMKIDNMSKRLAENQAERQERGAAQPGVEESLRNEIDRLIREGHEKNQILQDRNDELVRVKSEMDRLADRINQIENAASQAEGELASDAERMGAEFQAQLALLQAELSQKEWALEEQRATAKGIGQAHAQQIETLHHQYRQEIEAIRQRYALTESRSNEYNDRFVLGEDRLNAEQKERLVKFRDAMAAATNGIDVSFPASEHRRWHSRFNWKRRWKT